MPNVLLKWPIMGQDGQYLAQNCRFSVNSIWYYTREKIIDCSQGSIDLADKGCQQPTLSSKVADVDPWR